VYYSLHCYSGAKRKNSSMSPPHFHRKRCAVPILISAGSTWPWHTISARTRARSGVPPPLLCRDVAFWIWLSTCATIFTVRSSRAAVSLVGSIVDAPGCDEKSASGSGFSQKFSWAAQVGSAADGAEARRVILNVNGLLKGLQAAACHLPS
jgi:hypothetical protein